LESFAEFLEREREREAGWRRGLRGIFAISWRREPGGVFAISS
jgi:hypothetical protein